MKDSVTVRVCANCGIEVGTKNKYFSVGINAHCDGEWYKLVDRVTRWQVEMALIIPKKYDTALEAKTGYHIWSIGDIDEV